MSDTPPTPRRRILRRVLIGTASVLTLLVLGYLWAAYRPTGFQRAIRETEARIDQSAPLVNPLRPGGAGPRPLGPTPLASAGELYGQAISDSRYEASILTRMCNGSTLSAFGQTVYGAPADADESLPIGGQAMARSEAVADAVKALVQAASPLPTRAQLGSAWPRFLEQLDLVADAPAEGATDAIVAMASDHQLHLLNVGFVLNPLSAHAIAMARLRVVGRAADSDRILVAAAHAAALLHAGGIGANRIDAPVRLLPAVLLLLDAIEPLSLDTLERVEVAIRGAELDGEGFDLLRRAEVLRVAQHAKERAAGLPTTRSVWTYFMDGVPSRLVRRMARPVYERRVETLAMARMNGDHAAEAHAMGDLAKVMRVMDTSERVDQILSSDYAVAMESAELLADFPHIPTAAERYNAPLRAIRVVIAAMRHHRLHGEWPRAADSMDPPIGAEHPGLGLKWTWLAEHREDGALVMAWWDSTAYYADSTDSNYPSAAVPLGTGPLTPDIRARIRQMTESRFPCHDMNAARAPTGEEVGRLRELLGERVE